MKEATGNVILSYDEYSEIERRGFTTPYIVEVHKANQSLICFGSEHTNNPENPQFKDIEARWDRFVSNATNPIALVEGRFDEMPESDTSDPNNAIVTGGEALFLVYLARKDGVNVASPEPDRLWEANKLGQEFGRDNVIFYYFMRQIAWWNRLTQKPDVQAEAKNMLGLMEMTYQWDDGEFTIEKMASIHEELFDKPLSWDDSQWVNDITTPATQDYITNELARRSGDLRDEHILRQIQKYWREGKSQFLVFGSSHAIRLEPAIQTYVN